MALGEGLRSAARLARMDRKTVRRAMRRRPANAAWTGPSASVSSANDLLSRVAERSARTQPPRGDLREAVGRAWRARVGLHRAVRDRAGRPALLLHVRIIETLAHGRDLAWATRQTVHDAQEAARRLLGDAIDA